MNIEKEIIEESKALIKKLKEEEGRDITLQVKEVESQILVEYEKYETHRRLRHTKELAECFNSLEKLYLFQNEPRKTQMQRIEELKTKLRLLHQPFVERWLKDLALDVQDLLAKRSVHGKDDGTFDRETGEHLYLVDHNLKAVASVWKKIQSSIVQVREKGDSLSIDAIEKIFIAGHGSSGDQLKDEQMLKTRMEYEDLLAAAKQETPRFTEMTLAEMDTESQATRTISVLESLKSHFQ